MKRNLYIILFTILGLIVSFFIHAVVEVWYIKVLMNDFDTYGFGLTWENWESIHNVSVVLLNIIFAWWGYKQGKKWWRILYVEKKYKPHGKSLKENF
ncbi:MAG TPA: hypothetical protein VEC17_03655 [Candidatus Binatia bacterium]|nr:hypothetical protein [Candidatus Binatia bacterium]